MKHLILATLFTVSVTSAMETKHWLQEHIEKCKNGDLTTSDCRFMKKYIEKFYLPMCGGQGELSNGATSFTSKSDQKKVCSLINEALATQQFVNNIID